MWVGVGEGGKPDFTQYCSHVSVFMGILKSFLFVFSKKFLSNKKVPVYDGVTHFICRYTAKILNRKLETCSMLQENELRGHSPNSYFHVSMFQCAIHNSHDQSAYILLQENIWTDRENI